MQSAPYWLSEQKKIAGWLPVERVPPTLGSCGQPVTIKVNSSQRGLVDDSQCEHP
jgi:hypothetical protein